MKVLYTCIGNRDLGAVDGNHRGPVADVLRNHKGITHVALWVDRDEKKEKEDGDAKRYLLWLKETVPDKTIHPLWMGEFDPTNFEEVFRRLRLALEHFEQKNQVVERNFLVGPGTPTMAACTILMSRLKQLPGNLLQTDQKAATGWRSLELPVGLYIEDKPDPSSLKYGQRASSTDVIVKSASTVRAWQDAERAANSDKPVLILGASGTGKEKLAKHLDKCRNGKQQKQKKKESGKPVVVNCGAIPESLIESELFGHVKGAFTGAHQDRPGVFEQAGDGTVFLDEIGELPLAAQVRLLRVVQERMVRRVGSNEETKVSCLIVAATHRDLWQRVQEGSFREDLYYRLAVLIIRLEPLARRPEDLQAMIDKFWEKIVSENPGFPGQELLKEAKERLLAHDWPGNVRELDLVLTRAAFFAQGPLVNLEDIDLAIGDGKTTGRAISEAGTSSAAESLDRWGENYHSATKAFQRSLIEQTLARYNSKAAAARALGISAQHLNRILKGHSAFTVVKP